MAGERGSRRVDLVTHGTFLMAIPAEGLTPNKNVVASITELNAHGHPKIGDAIVTIHNVGAQPSQITRRGSVNYKTDLPMRLTAIYQ